MSTIDQRLSDIKQNFFDNIQAEDNGTFTYFSAGDINQELLKQLKEKGLDLQMTTEDVRYVGDLYTAHVTIYITDLEDGESLQFSWVGGADNRDKSIATAQRSALKHFIRNNFLSPDEETEADRSHGQNQGVTKGSGTKSRESDSEPSQRGTLFDDNSGDDQPAPTDGQLDFLIDLLEEAEHLSDRLRNAVLDAYDVSGVDRLNRKQVSQAITWLRYVLPGRETTPDDDLGAALSHLPDAAEEVKERLGAAA